MQDQYHYLRSTSAGDVLTAIAAATTQLRAAHTPPTEKHTQSHTRPPRHTHTRAVRLPSVDGMLPESWLMLNPKYLQDTNSHRVTPWHPTPPSQPPATHLSASHTGSVNRSNQLNSNRIKASQHTASYRSRTTPCASDPRTTQPDSPQVPDTVIPPHKPATLRRSRKPQRHHSDAMNAAEQQHDDV